MAASELDIKRVRRMTNEPTEDTYTNEDLASYIESYPLIDENGKTSSDSAWIAKYDLHATAADVWEEKAATLQSKHDFSADGASFSSNQMYENAMDQARYHFAKATIKAKAVHKTPVNLALDNTYGVIINQTLPTEGNDEIISNIDDNLSSWSNL